MEVAYFVLIKKRTLCSSNNQQHCRAAPSETPGWNQFQGGKTFTSNALSENPLQRHLSPCLTNHRWLHIIDWSYFKRRVTQVYFRWMDTHLEPWVIPPSHVPDLLAEHHQDAPVCMTPGVLFSTGAGWWMMCYCLIWSSWKGNVVAVLLRCLRGHSTSQQVEQILNRFFEAGSL